MRFTKMHGIGNDYLFFNCFDEFVPEPSRTAQNLCRQHFGAGADGIVLIEPSETADFGMQIFNPDGSEAEMCGNAARCIGKYAYERKLTDKTSLTLETKSGLKILRLDVKDGNVSAITVDMGTPELNPALLPVDLPGEIVLRHRLQLLGQTWFITCVNVGNPHCVVFVRDPEVVDVHTLGPMFEHHPLFPKRTNVEFARVIRRDVIQMRVWERGAGETLACGTGACAAVVASVLCGLSDRAVEVKLAGGSLQVNWNGNDDHIYQTGPAAFVYDGDWLGT